MRVIKTLARNHADFKAAMKDFTAIIGKIENPTSYPKMEDLKKDMEDWLEKYSRPSTVQKLNDAQKVMYIGII
jgi:hypothetical protein